MNNKELNFNIASEAFFNDIVKKLKKSKDVNKEAAEEDNEIDIELESKENRNENTEQKELLTKCMDHKLDKIIKDWYSSQDLLFCIHPIDGSILIW